MAKADPADPENPLLHWESLGESLPAVLLRVEVLCQAGGPPRGDLTPGGPSLLPISPRTLPSWPWHGNGKPPTGVRAGMSLFTLVYDRINHYLVLRGDCHVQYELRDTKDLLFSHCVCLS